MSVLRVGPKVQDHSQPFHLNIKQIISNAKMVVHGLGKTWVIGGEWMVVGELMDC